jgi:cardiolipin synthase
MGELWGRVAGHLPYAGALVEAFAFSLVPFVLVRRREPSSTIAWILTLVFLPGLGSLLFLLHGRDRMRWPAKRKRSADSVVAARLSAARKRQREPAAELAALHDNERRIFHVCLALGWPVEVSSGNRIELYTDGKAATEAMERAIEAAQRTVFAEYYLVRNDAAGERFRDKLVAAAQRGVEVRLLVDAYGCFWLPAAWFRALKRAGARVAEFLPLSLAVRLPMNLRTHRKILVVDGELGFTGGLNIGNEYVAATKAGPMWRDTHVAIRGPAVGSLTAIFLMDWHFMTNETELKPHYFPEPQACGSAVVAVVPSGPDNTSEAIHRAFFAAIVGARRRVWITTPYFVPDRSVLVALQTAALRGVDVKIILPSRSNHRVTHRAGMSYYAELLESGVELYEFLPGMIHAKTMLVDDEVALVGSANMDMRSFRLNFEVHAVAYDAGIASAIEDSFFQDRQESRKIDPKQWADRSWTQRVYEGVARLVSPIL